MVVVSDATASDLVGAWADTLRWQATVFTARPRRFDLLRLTPAASGRPVTLAVHRNQPFELVAALLPPFLAGAGLRIESIQYSDYDDSLGSVDGGAGDSSAPSPDVEIVSLDFERYRDRFSADDLCAWFVSRLLVLRRRTDRPILVTDWAARDPEALAFNTMLDGALARQPGLRLARVAPLRSELGSDWTDERSAAVKGTDLSDAALIALARQFGLRWLPALLAPPLKAVAVDLDLTLYDGVLGEDGPDGVTLTPAHAELQRRLVELHERGVFVAVLSKNERADVDALFATRKDFPLRAAQVDAWAVSWTAKAENLASIASQLHIAPDAVLVVDDNPGELASILAAFPAAPCLLADDIGRAANALALYPGLFRFSVDAGDERRGADIVAAQARDASLAAATDRGAYLRSLDIEVTLRRAGLEGIERLHQLSVKTNQFNTGLRRMSEAELARRLADGSLRAVAVDLRDRLSDSGTIAAVFARADAERLVVEEIAISCRALGRELEDVMIGTALEGLGARPGQPITFQFTAGPRNEPAGRWLARFAGQAIPEGGGEVEVIWDPEVVAGARRASPARVSWEADR